MISRDDTMYQKLLQSLLPKGKIWNRNPNSYLSKFLHGLAAEYSRIEGRSIDLFDESIPSQASELLTEYENDFGLYEENIEMGKTIEERVASVVTKLLAYGATNKQYYIDIGDGLGYTITIEEFTPAWAGLMMAGEPCGHLQNLFWWKVWIDIAFDINYNIEKLIFEIDRTKPAHTIVLFDFKGRAFNRAFSSAFFAQPYFDNSWGDNGYGQIGNSDLDFSRDFSNAFANAYDYDGNNYVGAFGHDFYIDYDIYAGGEISAEEFSIEFSIPH